MESPVWTPIMSKFSIEQMMMALSARSRITLHLVLLPAEHAFLDQDLPDGREVEALAEEGLHLFGVVCHAAARSAEGEARAEHDGIAHFGGELEAVVDIGDQPRPRHLQPDLGHCRLECLAVFGSPDGFEVRADQLDSELVQDALLGQRDGSIQAGLPAYR